MNNIFIVSFVFALSTPVFVWMSYREIFASVSDPFVVDNKNVLNITEGKLRRNVKVVQFIPYSNLNDKEVEISYGLDLSKNSTKSTHILERIRTIKSEIASSTKHELKISDEEQDRQGVQKYRLDDLNYLATIIA